MGSCQLRTTFYLPELLNSSPPEKIGIQCHETMLLLVEQLAIPNSSIYSEYTQPKSVCKAVGDPDGPYLLSDMKQHCDVNIYTPGSRAILLSCIIIGS